MKILDGGGSGREAKVTERGLATDSITNSSQHVISHFNSEAFQVEGVETIAATELNVLTLKNVHESKKLVITYIRVMSIGAATSNVDAYFNIKLAGGRISGGTEVTPVNMKSGSPKEATAEAYEGTLTLSGDELQIDRNYTANSMEKYGKEGVVILDTGQSITVTHKGSTVAGTAYARISFYME